MKTTIKTLLGTLVLAVTTLVAAPAYAQATRTWVSGVGDDVNPCSRTAPCKTYAGAISKTATNGEINCLDPGGFGSVTITKSISIVCDYTEGGALVSGGGTGFIINAPVGSIITLKGLDIECIGTGNNGISVSNAGVTVHVHKTQIRNCRGGNGILVAPSSGTARVFVADSYLTDNGATTSHAGILVKPTAGAGAKVSVNRVQFENNTNGIFADGSGGGGQTDVTVSDSLVGGSSNAGIAVSSAGAAFNAVVVNSTINFNSNVGTVVGGVAGTIWLSGSTISGNATGVRQLGGSFMSFGNNVIVGNVLNGTPISGATVLQ